MDSGHGRIGKYIPLVRNICLPSPPPPCSAPNLLLLESLVYASRNPPVLEIRSHDSNDDLLAETKEAPEVLLNFPCLVPRYVDAVQVLCIYLWLRKQITTIWLPSRTCPSTASFKPLRRTWSTLVALSPFMNLVAYLN